MKQQSRYWELAEYLTWSRKKTGLTQKEVSQRLGYSTAQFISNFERGQAIPPLSKLPKLIKILGLDPVTYVDLYIRGLRHELRAKLLFRAPKKAWDRYRSPK